MSPVHGPTLPIRLLLVEDEPVNRALVRAIVAKASTHGVGPFELVEAEDLEAARGQLGKSRFRAILLDVRLPDGNGLDLVPEVSEAGAERPWVVVISASVHLDDRLRALGAGADVFIGKPIEPGQLIEILERVAREPSPSAAA